MTGAAGAGAAAAAAGAAIAQATKASGAIVKVRPRDFRDIVERAGDLLVVRARRSFWTGHRYLTSYRGLFFFTQSDDPISLPTACEIVEAEKIWIP